MDSPNVTISGPFFTQRNIFEVPLCCSVPVLCAIPRPSDLSLRVFYTLFIHSPSFPPLDCGEQCALNVGVPALVRVSACASFDVGLGFLRLWSRPASAFRGAATLFYRGCSSAPSSSSVGGSNLTGRHCISPCRCSHFVLGRADALSPKPVYEWFQDKAGMKRPGPPSPAVSDCRQYPSSHLSSV